MTKAASAPEIAHALEAVERAHGEGRLSPTAVDNLRQWLTEPRYVDYRQAVLHEVDGGNWQQLDDVFWTVIPFGTGGRRGRMHPFGSNAINDRTIGESAQGLADYVRGALGDSASLSCAIAYDTRHHSRRFAELCAGIMVAAGFKVYFLDDYRSTPELSFAVRFKECHCGIMVTASHNPPSDNAVKVYWGTGGQVLPPHDKAIIDHVMQVQEIRLVPFADALADGRVEICTDQIDRAYLDAAAATGFAGPRELRVLYSPLHGVGASAVLPLLQRSGFADVELYQGHAEPSPDFPNVPGHVANPENTAVFDEPIAQARASRRDLILATDPDCDRLGVAAPVTTDPAGPWRTFNGNQIGALLVDYILTRRQSAESLSQAHFVVKTLVTSELVCRIAESYGVRCIGDLLVGFKYIGGTIDREGPGRFVFGCEESHGYLVGTHVRDKDAPVACMLMCELAAWVKAGGRSLHDQLDDLYRRHGYHAEHLINVSMEGSEGMAAMERLMAAFRQTPPESLAGIGVRQVRDYLTGKIYPLAAAPQPLNGPSGNLVILDLEEEGNAIAVRPSGTEPKVKFYLFTRLDPEKSQDLDRARHELAQRLAALETDVRSFAAGIAGR